MRDDQFQKLQRLEEKLIDVFLDEADPAGWPGQGIKIGAMDQQTRGDLYWCRKTAASVLVLASKVQSMTNTAVRNGLAPGSKSTGGRDIQDVDDGAEARQQAHQEQQLDADYDRAERAAAKLMRELQNATGGSKLAFDRRTHGKA